MYEQQKTGNPVMSMLIWMFTTGWPVGLGVFLLGITKASTLGWTLLWISIIGGYTFKYWGYITGRAELGPQAFAVDYIIASICRHWLIPLSITIAYLFTDGLHIVRDPDTGMMLIGFLTGAGICADIFWWQKKRQEIGQRILMAHQNQNQQKPALQKPTFCEVYRPPRDPNALNQVVGLDEAKTLMVEAVHLILNTEEGQKMKAYGLTPPKGILLYGPPGTGKTSFARATAAYFGLPFIVVNASAVCGSLVGQTEHNVRTVFNLAKQIAPCIVFWDEIDAVGKMRTGGDSNTPSQLALNVLLTELDGFQPLNRVVFIAATNRRDILDQALLRPGRFDRHIYVDLPDYPARQKLFRMYLSRRPVQMAQEDVDCLAKITEGRSPAEIAAAVTEAARLAYRENQPVTRRHVEEVLRGEEGKV
ncbi:MAG: AAA family ATPase [Firmicutes bacterium]|nr:AAA family ATPase [Bacillota bacterium]